MGAGARGRLATWATCAVGKLQLPVLSALFVLSVPVVSLVAISLVAISLAAISLAATLFVVGLSPSAPSIASVIACFTAMLSRKRTSLFVGWTFTSTWLGGNSIKRNSAGFMSPCLCGYASRTA